MRVAIVGATGMVGEVMLKVLEERAFPVTELYPVASERSVGKEIEYAGTSYTVIGLAQAVSLKPDLAIFSAGGTTSLEWAPKFAEVGTTVIDNSSAWRMDPTKKLIVPEINAAALSENDKIIANPNCSTIQLVMVLAPLHAKYKMKRVVVSTYQSVSGTGVKAVQQLENEIAGVEGEGLPTSHPQKCLAALRCIPGKWVYQRGNETREGTPKDPGRPYLFDYRNRSQNPYLWRSFRICKCGI